MSVKISDKDLLDELARLTKELGRTPRREDVDAYGKFSANSYKRAFGIFSNALMEVGEKPNQLRNQTKENVVSEIRRVYKELGRIPTAKEFTKFASMTFQTLRNICGDRSWHSLLKEAGISDEEMVGLAKHGVSNEELKEEIIRFKNFLGRYPTYKEMKQEGKYSCNTYENRFGSWSKAFIALGFTDYVSQSVFKNQIHVIGKDSTVYRSNFEARIGDLLLKLKEEVKIKGYEYERKVCPGKSWTCDFVIMKLDNTELWIEADGMMDNRKDPYDEKNEKIAYYKQHNISYVIFDYRVKFLESEFLKTIGINKKGEPCPMISL